MTPDFGIAKLFGNDPIKLFEHALSEHALDYLAVRFLGDVAGHFPPASLSLSRSRHEAS